MLIRSSLPMHRAAPFRLFLICAVSAVVLSGCGRRGPLEPPPKAAAPTENTLSDDPEENMDDPSLISPSPNPSGRASRVIKAPKKPFILDPLL